MYILKNAFRSIGRSMGRSILIGIIVLVIAVASCLGLSITQASESAKKAALEGVKITATISYNRAGEMNKIGKGGFSGEDFGSIEEFDKDSFKELMGNMSSLTLDEYKMYAEADSVSGFYYTLTAYFNGSEGLEPVSDESSESSGESQGGWSIPGGIGGQFSQMFDMGDFTIVGYSSDIALTDFADGTTSILEGGAMFEEGTENYECVVSEELALYNNLSVGDTIIVSNPEDSTETYELTITGIYSSTQTNKFSSFTQGASQDPANRILMSAASLQKIIDASEVYGTDEETEESDKKTNITGSLEATYTFATSEDYEAFEGQVREMGLDESYTISSNNLTSYENSLAPLETLSTMAKWFLVVILAIGGVILVVFNIFNIRERKYEVGVLTAMGMKKWKVASQFVCEILAITMVAVVIGAGIGGVCSVPVTNALLENQVQSQQTQQTNIENNFGREGNFGNFGGIGGFPGDSVPGNIPSDFSGGDTKMKNPFEQAISDASDYVTQVDSAMNLTVVFQMLGIGLLLTLMASAVSILFIMRYDPLKILISRD